MFRAVFTGTVLAFFGFLAWACYALLATAAIYTDGTEPGRLTALGSICAAVLLGGAFTEACGITTYWGRLARTPKWLRGALALLTGAGLLAVAASGFSTIYIHAREVASPAVKMFAWIVPCIFVTALLLLPLGWVMLEAFIGHARRLASGLRRLRKP